MGKLDKLNKYAKPFKNARAMHLAHPHTFFLPDYKKMKKLTIDDYVKVSSEGERFWIQITNIGKCRSEYDSNCIKHERLSSDIMFTGIVANELKKTDSHGYKEGMTVSCKAEQVYEILINKDKESVNNPINSQKL